MPVTEAGVDTAAFCEAAENLVKIFGELAWTIRSVRELIVGLFGNPAFVVVQNDLTGNIAVRLTPTSSPSHASSLVVLIDTESPIIPRCQPRIRQNPRIPPRGRKGKTPKC